MVRLPLPYWKYKCLPFGRLYLSRPYSSSYYPPCHRNRLYSCSPSSSASLFSVNWHFVSLRPSFQVRFLVVYALLRHSGLKKELRHVPKQRGTYLHSSHMSFSCHQSKGNSRNKESQRVLIVRMSKVIKQWEYSSLGNPKCLQEQNRKYISETW